MFHRKLSTPFFGAMLNARAVQIGKQKGLKIGHFDRIATASQLFSTESCTSLQNGKILTEESPKHLDGKTKLSHG